MSTRTPGNALRPLARARRLSLDAQWRSAFRSACLDTGTSYAAVAEAVGITPQRVEVWANGAEGEPLPNVLHVAAMPPAVRSRLRAWEAARDACVMLPACADELQHAERLSVLTRELLDVPRAYANALADQHVSAAERAELVRELQDVVDVAAPALLALKTGSDAP